MARYIRILALSAMVVASGSLVITNAHAFAGEWTKCIAWKDGRAFNIVNGQGSQQVCFAKAAQCLGVPRAEATYYSNPVLIAAPYERCMN